MASSALLDIYNNFASGIVRPEAGLKRDFSVIDFVLSNSPDNSELTEREFDILLKLSRKLEIKRELELYYSRHDFKPIIYDGIANTDLVNALLCIYIKAFQQSGDFRFLNTILKTATYGLSKPFFEQIEGQLNSIVETLIGDQKNA